MSNLSVRCVVDWNIRDIPSPNQTPIVESRSQIDSNSAGKDHWPDMVQMKFFADRLQPQQWLGPANMAWVSDKMSSNWKAC